MDSDREEEILLGVAAGLDHLTAVIVAADDPQPPKRKVPGCLSAVLLIIAGIVAWAIVVGF